HTHLADLSRRRWRRTVRIRAEGLKRTYEVRPFGFNAMAAYLRESKNRCESPLTGPAWVEGKSRKGGDLCRHLCKKWRGWLEREDQRVLREAYRPFGEEPPRRKERT
ncbi:unnamed protein product, partial [Symbiodinium sp. KB8]